MGSADPASIRRLAGIALVTGLSVAAAAAVLALLTGSFDDTDTRVILSSIGFSLSSAVGASGAAARLRPSGTLRTIGLRSERSWRRRSRSRRPTRWPSCCRCRGRRAAGDEDLASAVARIADRIDHLNSDPGNRAPEIRAEVRRLRELARSYEK